MSFKLLKKVVSIFTLIAFLATNNIVYASPSSKSLFKINFLENFFNLKVSNEDLDYYLYKVVKERDIAMVENSLFEIEKRNAKVSSLIAGGFHSLRVPLLFNGRSINPFLLFKAERDRGNITIDKKTIIIAMGGGDTAGLNDFLADAVEKLIMKGYKVIGVRNGFKGLKSDKLEDNLVELTLEIAASMRGLPSIALGSCREKLAEGDISKIVEILKHSAGAIFIGGNDHLKNVEQVAAEVKRQRIDIVVVGVPKSIDNDFMTIMHGFWSAVVAGRQIVAKASIDPEKENAKIAAVFECMGRKSGSLTLELSKACPHPRAVIVPEKPVTIESVINAANNGIRNFFVSEGFSLSDKDPKLEELLNAYPVLRAMWEKIKTSPDKDQHGNPKLTGASLFVKGILEHFCNLKVEKTDLTYQLRGAFLQPDTNGIVFDTFLAHKFSDEVISLIKNGRSGMAVTYSGKYGDTHGKVKSKPAKDVYKSRDLSSIFTEESLASLGVLGVLEHPILYNAVTETAPARNLSLDEAVREAFYGISISTAAHRYASVVELRESPEIIISSCDGDRVNLEKLPYDLRTVIEATRDSVLVLTPEMRVGFKEIADKIKGIYNNSGYINVAISKDFMLDPDDRLLSDILATDPVLKARFENEGIIDKGTGLVKFESGISNFIVGLFKYLIKQNIIKVEGTKITDLGYAFKGIASSSGIKAEYLLEERRFRLKLEPIAARIGEEIIAKIQAGEANPVISIDGDSGAGKTILGKEVARYLKEKGYQSVTIGLDMFLKDRTWRHAIQKLVTGEPLTKPEEELLGEMAQEIQAGQPYLNEETFFDHAAILKMLQGIDSFRNSRKPSHIIHIPGAYNQETKERFDFTSDEITRETVVIVEGKYANSKELQPYYDSHYRLKENPEQSRRGFKMRTTMLSPADADRQMVFYDLALVLSYEAVYVPRTQNGIDCLVDLSGEKWELIPLRGQRLTEPGDTSTLRQLAGTRTGL
ncbi:MAG TPA: hypothetical protein DCY56_05710 [Candidatus Omnitrophica bacterium]|nr:hypothetical protein [Candidatus Omnitrophota bacterium]